MENPATDAGTRTGIPAGPAAWCPRHARPPQWASGTFGTRLRFTGFSGTGFAFAFGFTAARRRGGLRASFGGFGRGRSPVSATRSSFRPSSRPSP
jgi:hypothetical protein